MRAPGPAERGLTLIEITIGLAIAALAAGVAVASLNALTNADLKSAGRDLSGVMKFCYDRAIMERRTERLSIDIDKGTFWIDYSDETFALAAEREKGRAGEKVEAGPAQGKKEEERSVFDEDEDEEVKRALEGGRAADFQGEEGGEPRRLPGNIKVSKVWTGHQEEAFTSGVARVHFFSGGWSEPAQVELLDGEEALSLKLYPLTGRVRIYDKALDTPRAEEDDGREEGDE